MFQSEDVSIVTRGRLCTMLALAALLTGCDQQATQPPVNIAASAPVRTAAIDSAVNHKVSAASVEPVTLEEGQEFATRFEAAVLGGDHAGITAQIDWRALLRNATADLEVGQGFRDEFVEGALREKGALARQLTSTARSGGFRLLRVYMQDDEPRALFRGIQPSGVKYQELLIGRSHDGDVCATDVYSFLSAERLSRTMRRMFLLAAAEQPTNPLAGMLDRNNDFVKHTKEFRSMSSLTKQGKGKEVLELYESLPTTMRSEKTVMLLYVRAAERVDDEAYAQAIDEFRRLHPDDPCLDMVSIDGFVLREQYDDALEAVNRIDAAVSGDPYMNVLRANISLMRDDAMEAEKFAQLALTQEPELIDAYWALVTVSLARQRFADTAKWLSTIRDEFDVRFDDLRKIPDYSEFVQSPEFETWSNE